jgi:hypothetical protein
MLIAPDNLARTAVLFVMFVILAYQQFVSLPTLILRRIIVTDSLMVLSAIIELINQILI